MKTRLLLVVVLLLGVLLGWGVSRLGGKPGSAGAAAEKTLYTCGMHPQIVQDHPGNCPICGMKLTPIRKQDAGTNAAAGAAIAIDPVTVQNMGIRTATVTRGPLRKIIRTVGNVEYSEAALTEVTTKAKGWIEKLHVDTTGQQVHRGDVLFDFYAPEYFSAQAEFVQALGAGGGAALRQSAERKLKFFDFTDEQIAALEKSRQPQKTVPVRAPADGVVLEKMAVAGQMVEAGMKLYQLADLGLVWIQAQIYERDLAFVKPGQEATVTLSYLPDRHFRGRVTYLYPNVDEKTRTAKVRMEFPNPGYLLKPGMFAEVRLESELEPAVLLVPEMAVLRSGEQNTVFVALEGGHFDPRTVRLGATAENGMVQILDGLKEGERIVTSGQFMLDSESQLREAIQKMQQPTAAPPSAISAVVKYTCPMASHAHIVTDKPGLCPECEMQLVPTTTVAHGKQSEAAWRRLHPAEKK